MGKMHALKKRLDPDAVAQAKRGGRIKPPPVFNARLVKGSKAKGKEM